MWLLWILLIPVILVIVILLVRSLKPLMVPPPIEHHISLTEVNEAGTGLGETKFYTLKDKGTLEFGQRGPKELQFDVGSEAFLYCNRKSLLFFADPDDDDGHILDLPETLTVSQGEEDSVHIRCEVVDDSSEEPEEVDEPILTRILLIAIRLMCDVMVDYTISYPSLLRRAHKRTCLREIYVEIFICS